jgi:hypothetical protein
MSEQSTSGQEASHVPVTFWGYDDIIWSPVGGGAEPSADKELIPPSSYIRFTVLAGGETEAEARAAMLSRHGAACTRVEPHSFEEGPELWFAYHDTYFSIEKGSWGEIKQALREIITEVGGTDKVFFEGIDESDELHDGAPVYVPSMGS